MNSSLRIAVIGDFDPGFAPHRDTEAALRHSAAWLGVAVEIGWVATGGLEEDLGPVRAADALWCAPGSPYRSLTGAVDALRHGRERGIPTLGTCGGCQHMIIEYARNVMGFVDARHAEYDPYGSELFVSELTCSLAGKTMPVRFAADSRTAGWYGAERATERYYCNFGLNPEHRKAVHEAGLRVVGEDDDGEARVLEIPEHPFYVATLFVPQARSTPELPHPLVTALLRAAA